jgi:hypothetical protein
MVEQNANSGLETCTHNHVILAELASHSMVGTISLPSETRVVLEASRKITIRGPLDNGDLTSVPGLTDDARANGQRARRLVRGFPGTRRLR